MILLRACLGLALLFFPGFAFAQENTPVPRSVPPRIAGPAAVHPLPVFHIPLRVHLGDSGRSVAECRPILEEINEIWLSQAGICFEMEIVANGEPNPAGIDLWFEPVLVQISGGLVNGYYLNDHAIHVRDTPLLGPADHPAHYPAARTAAHELGHSLGLPHRQDSDDNLMRSQTYGWKLNADEISHAREAAGQKALQGRTEEHCGIVPMK